MASRLDHRTSFHFVRHGATEHNLRGLRCGGDVDVDLTEGGRIQAHEAAQRLRMLGVDTRLIISSGLARARQTASIVSAALGGVPVTIEPLLNERLLGQWNGRPVEETEALLVNNVTPPGGESEDAFVRRVRRAVEKLAPQLTSATLVVSSRGVGRVMHTLFGGEGRFRLANGEVARFSFAPAAFLTQIVQEAA
jgi:probable phosphoglycerate mutase